jgi:hypothetical protein
MEHFDRLLKPRFCYAYDADGTVSIVETRRRGNRESGANPELPRSGQQERKPSSSTGRNRLGSDGD